MTDNLQAITCVHGAPVEAHGFEYEAPQVHENRKSEPSVDFLRYLQERGLSLEEDDNFNVEEQHKTMTSTMYAIRNKGRCL